MLLTDLKSLKLKVSNRYSLFRHKFKMKYILPLGVYDKKILSINVGNEWERRIQDVINCPDNKYIQRHSNAGFVSNGKQVMHNGIEITLGGYYGSGIAQMLYRNKGVHEPQEEYAFELVLDTIPAGATMIELGAYWSFYSMWFLKRIPDAKSYLIEPDKYNLLYGLNNFRINGVKGSFFNAYVGDKTVLNNGHINAVCIDDFAKNHNIGFIDILHSDIQGFEHAMLNGSRELINNHKIGYLFISTHGNKVHYDCIDFLVDHNYQILCHADEFQTYSLDGLIVAKSPFYEGLEKVDISLKPQ